MEWEIKALGCLVEEFNNVIWVFFIYVWIEKCMKIYVNVFKMFKSVFEMSYQTDSTFGSNFLHQF